MKKWCVLTKLLVLFGALATCDVAYAVDIELTAEDIITHEVGYSDAKYKPLVDKGLRTVADLHFDDSGSGFFGYWSMMANAAVYGSDFSVSSGPGAITPYGVEPMAFTQVYAKNSIPSASAFIEVDHKVIVDPVKQSTLPPGVLGILNATNAVHVTLKARMECSRQKPSDWFYVGFGIYGGDPNPIDLWLEFNDSWISDLSFQFEGELKFTVEPSNVQQDILYHIWAEAYILVSGPTPTAENPNPLGHNGVAVVDPFLQIDPDWTIPELAGTGYDAHGANYFVVQQESLVNPGEWIGISREWKTVITSDFDEDGDIDGLDLALFVHAYQNTLSEADLSLDEIINSDDVGQFAKNFGS